MGHGDSTKPLVGDEMVDRSANVLPPGQAIMVKDSKIQRIDDSELLCSEFAPWWDGSNNESDGVTVVDAGGRAVIPGLVDCHTHLLWGGDRSSEMRLRQAGMTYRQIADAGGGIAKTVESTREMSLDDLCRIGMSRLHQAALTGTTVIEAKSGYGLDTVSELRLLEAMKLIDESSKVKLLPTWLGAHDFPPGCTRSDYLDELVGSQLPAVAEQGIARWADVFCERGWFSIEETENIAMAAAGFGIPSRLHVDEFEDSGGLALAAELGSISGDHAAKSSVESRHAAADSGTMQTFLPGTPYVLGENLESPLNDCINNNWPFSLATDYNPNCRILSMPFIGNLVTTRLDLDPFAALVATTRNPSTTLGDIDVTGTIEEGSRADLNILWSQSVDGWCQTPGENPIVTTIVGGTL